MISPWIRRRTQSFPTAQLHSSETGNWALERFLSQAGTEPNPWAYGCLPVLSKCSSVRVDTYSPCSLPASPSRGEFLSRCFLHPHGERVGRQAPALLAQFTMGKSWACPVLPHMERRLASAFRVPGAPPSQSVLTQVS